MKLFFRYAAILCCLPATCLARDIIVITHNQQIKKANTVKELLKEQVSLPSELISVSSQVSPCIPRKQSIVHICVDTDGSVHFVEFKQDIVESSLSVFWRGDEK